MKKYKKTGIKLTPQRLAILHYLDGNTDHPSAEDVYKAMSRKFPTMSFATVYNTLETLRGMGMVSELNIDPSRKRFDPDTEPHHHLICVECKRIVDIRENYELKVPDEKKGDFEITGNHIEFYGMCPECKKEN